MQLTSFRAPAPLEYVSDAATLQDLKKSVATWEHKVKLAEVPTDIISSFNCIELRFSLSDGAGQHQEEMDRHLPEQHIKCTRAQVTMLDECFCLREYLPKAKERMK